MQRDSQSADLNGCRFIGTDINPNAIECAQRVAELNKTTIEFVLEEGPDMPFLKQAEYLNSVDIIIFNPPYVVTSQEELNEAQEKKGIEASWAGGKDGIEVLLHSIP